MFVFCRQRQDLSLRRGGEQVSVVCISRHPFSSILKPLSQVAGALFFSHGASGLDALYQESLGWPAPTMGLNSIEVGMTSIQGLLPHASVLPHPTSQEPFLLDPIPSSRDDGDTRLWSDRGEYYDNGGLYTPESPARDAMRRTWHEGDRSNNEDSVDEPDDYGGDPPDQRRETLTSRHRHTIDDVITLRPNDLPTSPAPSSALSSPFTSAVDAARIASGDLGDAKRPVKKPSPSPLNVPSNPAPSITPLISILPPLTSLGTAFCEVDVYSPLQAHVNRLWTLWELVLLAQPLMIVGLSPCDTCQAIAALISLIGPLPYRPDFRPFLTIHDASFTTLTSNHSPERLARDDVPRLFGVTNLYFLKALESWPNVLSVGKKETAASSWTETKAQKNAGGWGGGLIAGLKATLQQKSGRGPQSLLFDGHSESLWSSYRPLMTPDRNIIARLIKPAPTDSRTQLASIASVNNEILRMHFYELTTSLLAPFSPYIPTSPLSTVPKWSSFHFLASASTSALSFPPLVVDRLGGKMQVVCEFYSRLVASPNFCYWITQAQSQLPPHLILDPPPLPAVAIREMPSPAAAQEDDEVTRIDLFFETELKYQETHPSNTAELSRLSSSLIFMFFRLPLDFQLICLSSPQRKNLLYSLPMSSTQTERLMKLGELLLQK